MDIKSVLSDVKGIQEETQEVANSTRQIDYSVEEVIFKDANLKKDKLAKDIYQEVQNLKTNFDKVITCVQEENKVKNQIRDVDAKNEEFRIKYKNDIDKLKNDLGSIHAENQQLNSKL